MRRRRTNLDIKADILRASKDGSKKSWIIYDTRLNFTIRKQYFSELMEHGMLAIHEGSIYYKTTEKGLEFLQSYDMLRKFSKA